jgi:sugar phosphate isomerase/epimerase
MSRPVTLFTGQWADLPIESICQKASKWGYDGIELPCWGDHFNVQQALSDDKYCQGRHDLLAKYGLKVWAISNHLVGQAVCDVIDERHKLILPEHVWGDGDPKGVKDRAAKEMIDTARAAAKLGVKVVNGFTGSSIWHLLYSFPPVSDAMIAAGYKDFADRFNPIMDEFKKLGLKFGLEVHPTEIAFDVYSAERAIQALKLRTVYGFN